MPSSPSQNYDLQRTVQIEDDPFILLRCDPEKLRVLFQLINEWFPLSSLDKRLVRGSRVAEEESCLSTIHIAHNPRGCPTQNGRFGAPSSPIGGEEGGDVRPCEHECCC